MPSQPVAEYIAARPPVARKALRELRAAIRKAVPGLTERISYGVPTFDLDGRYLLYIAAFKEHVSVYPVTARLEAKCGKAIAPFRHGRGTMRFSLEKRLPIALVGRLAKERAIELRASRRSGR